MIDREYIFDEPVLHGVNGRNGYSHVAGVSVVPMGRGVMMTPIGTKGHALQADIQFFSADCGRIARMLAETAARSAPEARESIAAELRAALVAIESGFDDQPSDGVSSFSYAPR